MACPIIQSFKYVYNEKSIKFVFYYEICFVYLFLLVLLALNFFEMLALIISRGEDMHIIVAIISPFRANKSTWYIPPCS